MIRVLAVTTSTRFMSFEFKASNRSWFKKKHTFSYVCLLNSEVISERNCDKIDKRFVYEIRHLFVCVQLHMCKLMVVLLSLSNQLNCIYFFARWFVGRTSVALPLFIVIVSQLGDVEHIRHSKFDLINVFACPFSLICDLWCILQ